MDFLSGIAVLYDPLILGVILAGTLGGIIMGALPGLSSPMAVALLLPFTVYLEPIPAIALLSAVYCAGTYGGSITAILINAPGAPPAAATVFDGYPMAAKGQAGRALGMAAVSSACGGIFSLIVLILAAPWLAELAYAFGPPEFFALTIFSMSMLGSMSGKSSLKNLIGGGLGVFLATIGVDLTTGVERYTFGIPELYEGVHFVPVLIGLFALSELLVQSSLIHQVRERVRMSVMKLPTLDDYKRVWKTILRSSVIGTGIGVLPAEGGTIAALIGYNEARRWSSRSENFGEGEIEGIAGPEAANNAATGGALVPTLALGIPGSATTAVMLGALQIQGLQPGPFLFEQQPDLLYGIFYSMLAANILFLFVGLGCAKLFSRISMVPPAFLWPAVFALCVVGAYGITESVVDVYIMFLAGLAGYALRRYGFSPAPIVMGLVLGKLMENSLAQSMILLDHNPLMFFQRPITVLFFLFGLIGILAPQAGRWMRRRSSP